MQPIFNNKVMPPLGNHLLLTALQRLQFLLTSGNHCIDTEAEVKFLLNHRNDSIDTPMEINEWIDDLINKIKNYNPEVVNNPELETAINNLIIEKLKDNPNVVNNPELITAINNLINKLEAAGHQNGPGL